jgi:uncharacterized protein with PQ loop repeat
MYSLNNLFGFLGTIMSIAFSLSPMQTMLESLKTKQIKNISVVFLKVQSTMFICWFLLGIKISDTSLAISNGVGLILNLFYIGIFYYVHNKYNEIFIYCGLFIALNPLFYVLFNATILEIMAGILNMSVAASMYIKIREALATKDSGFVNIPLLFGGFGCAVTWDIYGLMNGYVAVVICTSFLMFTVFVNAFVYFWAIGYFEDNNFVINILKIVLKVDDSNNKTVYQKRKLIDF